MATTEFDIDSYIGEWGYSNRYVKSYLNAAGKNPVVCHVCSGGGDFLMAINIKDQFARKCNCRYFRVRSQCCYFNRPGCKTYPYQQFIFLSYT